MQKKLRDAFKAFYNNVADWTQRMKDENSRNTAVEFDLPVRELGFQGVPGKSTVLCQPTTHCLVNLTDQTPFVLSLADVERVSAIMLFMPEKSKLTNNKNLTTNTHAPHHPTPLEFPVPAFYISLSIAPLLSVPLL